MLEEIRIRGLGVIDDAQLDLGPGLTVVTGETGAGKTMVLTGLNLLMGGRADGGAVRSGAERALVEGRIRVAAGGVVAERAVEAGADLEEIGDGQWAELLLSRTVQAEGRSRAYVGGRSAPVGLLTELAEGLVAVHGQSDQQRLLRPSRQLNALDRYAGEAVSAPMTAYAARFARMRVVQAELTEVTTRARERAREADLLRLGLAEIESVDPQPGEDLALLAEEDRLANAGALRSAAESAHLCLSADETAGDQADVLSLLARARQALEGERAHDPALSALAERLAEAAYLVGDVAADLASYSAAIDTDPARLAGVQERRAALIGLTRKYGDDRAAEVRAPGEPGKAVPATPGGGVEAVLEWAEAGSHRLLELDGDDDRVASLREERETLLAELSELAATVTKARSEAAERFSAEVSVELTALAMPHARIVVDVRPRDAAGRSGVTLDDGTSLGATGADDVEILFSAHNGAQPRPLDKGASGGELSRLMLAVEVVFAGADPVPTFVFDEVDAGVGGKAAVEVGRRLASLARHAQVLVVTHLPQVAAFADQHLKVVKADDGRVTSSGIESLDEAGRIGELSRMLAGLEGSASARAHAEELLAAAAASKRQRS